MSRDARVQNGLRPQLCAQEGLRDPEQGLMQCHSAKWREGRAGQGRVAGDLRGFQEGVW